MVSFKDAETEGLFVQRKSRKFANIANVALRKLDQLEISISLKDLRVPPSNRLEALSKDRKGQHSIRVNDQFRICFVWKADGAHNVEIVDYH